VVYHQIGTDTRNTRQYAAMIFLLVLVVLKNAGNIRCSGTGEAVLAIVVDQYYKWDKPQILPMHLECS
jgi:hypothetical protein